MQSNDFDRIKSTPAVWCEALFKMYCTTMYHTNIEGNEQKHKMVLSRASDRIKESRIDCSLFFCYAYIHLFLVQQQFKWCVQSTRRINGIYESFRTFHSLTHSLAVVFATFHYVLASVYSFSLLFVAILYIIQVFHDFFHPDTSTQFKPYIYLFIFMYIHTHFWLICQCEILCEQNQKRSSVSLYATFSIGIFFGGTFSFTIRVCVLFVVVVVFFVHIATKFVFMIIMFEKYINVRIVNE